MLKEMIELIFIGAICFCFNLILYLIIWNILAKKIRKFFEEEIEELWKK